MPLPRVCVLGLGSMGRAMTRRLREQGHNVAVWNRSESKALSLAGEVSRGSCISAPTPAGAISSCSDSAVALLVLTSTANVLDVLRYDGIGKALQGRTLVNLTSGNPDDGRQVAKAVEEVAGNGCKFVDGAYCGNPTKARSGSGQLFLSSHCESVVEEASSALSDLGSVAYCGAIGSSRALDYAVVDLFFANLLSFMSNAAALEKEGVDMKQCLAEMKKRLDTVPGVLELYHERMKSRQEDAYARDVTVSLSTSKNYWASRLPYNDTNGIPSDFANLYVELLQKASGSAGQFSESDLSRLQEAVRYGCQTPPCDKHDEPSKK
eukprot:TRINITY_DN95636_c0_g1_i1.p1 TRINITY_DN95636_c0_g1~~TRINITY_DN95636_c0_g1_i1.p1  ORF type:complete len:322 (+),score=44.37 TRINITY_DN95636_c0_g1_i1:146-1111(+)